MGFFKEIFEDITGMSKRPEIKGSRFEKFVSEEIFIDKLFKRGQGVSNTLPFKGRGCTNPLEGHSRKQGNL